MGPHARRAGWVGCNILLANLPSDAKILVIVQGEAVSPAHVRRQYARLRPLGRRDPERRGWTLHVLNVVRSLEKAEFDLDEVYAHQKELENLHPANRHVGPKIRQQLQVLRDMGLVEFLGHGRYRLT